MRTAPSHRSEHGGHLWWSAVLVLATASLVAAAWVTATWPPSWQRFEPGTAPTGLSGSMPLERVDDGLEHGADQPAVLRASGRPLRLHVPSLGLHTSVVPIDLTGTTLKPPGDPGVIGWWREGAMAGSGRGAVVLTGHTVHTGGGAMDDLELLRRGDEVALTVRGATIGYRVDRIEVLGKSALAEQAQTLFRQRGPERLVMVTCENWNGSEYESNVVVTARATS